MVAYRGRQHAMGGRARAAAAMARSRRWSACPRLRGSWAGSGFEYHPAPLISRCQESESAGELRVT